MKKLLFLLVALTTSIAFGQKLYGNVGNEIYYIENCEKTTILNVDTQTLNAFEVIDNDNLLLILREDQNFYIKKYTVSTETFTTLKVLQQSTTSYFRYLNKLSDNFYFIDFANLDLKFNSSDNSIEFDYSGDIPELNNVYKLQKFGTRYAMTASDGSSIPSKLFIFNSITNLFAPLTITSGSFGYMGQASVPLNYAKLDENTAFVIYHKYINVVNPVLYFAKINTQNFTMDIYDSIIKPSVAYTDLHQITGMTSLEPNKVLITTSTGAGEGIGGILEYDINTRTYVVKHSFTNSNQTSGRNLPYQNKLFNSKIGYTLDPNNYNVNICTVPTELLNHFNKATKCPECISFSAGGSLGVKESMELSSISIHPNPTSSFITISNIPAEATISVLDYTGRIVLEKASKNTSEELDLSNCTPGMYIVQIASNNKLMQEKVIVK